MEITGSWNKKVRKFLCTILFSLLFYNRCSLNLIKLGSSYAAMFHEHNDRFSFPPISSCKLSLPPKGCHTHQWCVSSASIQFIDVSKKKLLWIYWARSHMAGAIPCFDSQCQFYLHFMNLHIIATDISRFHRSQRSMEGVPARMNEAFHIEQSFPLML